MSNNLIRLLSTSLILIGVISTIIFGYHFWQRMSVDRLAFDRAPVAQNEQVKVEGEDYPETLVIPEFALSLPIVPATVTSGKWETTAKGVSYLATSALPGEKGNSIMYGHNWPSILGDLQNIKKDYEIKVIYKSGSVKSFKVAHINVVWPDQTYLLDQANDTRLTLYTCTGFLDTKRFVVTALPN